MGGDPLLIPLLFTSAYYNHLPTSGDGVQAVVPEVGAVVVVVVVVPVVPVVPVVVVVRPLVLPVLRPKVLPKVLPTKVLPMVLPMVVVLINVLPLLFWLLVRPEESKKPPRAFASGVAESTGDA